MKRITIIHEFGAPEHYKGLLHLTKQEKMELRYFEFSFIRHLVKSIIRQDMNLFKKSIHNMLFLFVSFLFPLRLKDEIVILGIAPIDWRLILISRIVKNTKVIYHTSWHHWDGQFYPKKNYFFNKIETYWKKFLRLKIEAIAAVTPNTKSSLIKNYNINDNVISVVYHTYEKNIFNINKPLSMSTTKLNVIFVGRLSSSKGIPSIIKLIEALPNINFSIVGQGEFLDDLIRLSNTRKNLTVYGYIGIRKKLADILKQNDIIIQPSVRNHEWEELFGMAIIESMACGLVPIATDHSGPETILKGSTLYNNLIIDNGNFSYLCTQFKERILFYDKNRLELVKGKKQAAIIANQYEEKNISNIWNEILKNINYVS